MTDNIEQTRFKVRSSQSWEHTCKGGELCSGCRRPARFGEVRIWESSQDQDNLFCKNCAVRV